MSWCAPAGRAVGSFAQGLVIEVRANQMPDGGIVTTFTDMTSSVEAAEALERSNETLERRVHERTEELTRLNAALERALSLDPNLVTASVQLIANRVERGQAIKAYQQAHIFGISNRLDWKPWIDNMLFLYDARLK